ncbi:hypothetical protein HYG81_15260 [Natrinema zhouii]|uniref:Uncharacterized protein n=1 Tax=Natrinema zhouii TaxID=1710539 RepID=A0A7D6CPA2_9EURY|nr:hypothetical protein [Natrinema zhouii]QLK25429.1 hypothetical protein HYG81_15260 [Natrinema zhouii]
MSVHTTTPPQSIECGQCGDQFILPAVEGSFCSPECHDEHRREKLADDFFETLEHDHRFCSTCGRQLKEIEKPPERNSAGKSITDAAIGWEHVTEHGEFGIKSHIRDDGDDDLDVPDLDFEDGHDPVYVYDVDGEDHNVGTYADFRNPLPRSIDAAEPIPVGAVCRCGQTDHKHENETLRTRFPFTVAHYLAVAAATLHAEGKTDVRVDRERLFEAVLEGETTREAFASAVIVP